MNKNVRRHLIVKKDLQMKLAAIQVFSMLLVAATCLVTYKILIDYVRLSFTTSAQLESFIASISRTLAGQLIVLIIIGISVSILVSNKIVGPVYRLEKDIESILDDIEKNLSKRVKVRRGDELLTLVDTVNKLLDKFEEVTLKHKELILTLRNRFEYLKERFADSPEMLKQIEETEKILPD
ncbi:MAG: methyl-accepting chemotaxis protein [Elusimicrobia bacterium]|nr:methyl-accepting chemotaxis protein [Elusimicrobiota bacterium]